MKVGIIGGGASGLVAAIQAARSGHEVTILEHMDRIGKKLLSTGNGKCNLTNTDQSIGHYHGTNPEFAAHIFDECSYTDTLRFFTDIGIYTKNKNGGLYPYSEQASAVLSVLLTELEELHVHILCQIQIDRLEAGTPFKVWVKEPTSKKALKTISFDRLILAAGGKAARQTGSDGSGYRIAEAFGHRVIEPLPALVQLRSSQDFFKGIAGIRCDVRLDFKRDGILVCSEYGELQLTNYGISGIPVFQLSGRAARAIYKGSQVTIDVDFMPDMPSVQSFEAFLMNRIHTAPYKQLQDFLIGLFHKNLCALFLRQCGLKGTRLSDSLTVEEIKLLANCIKQFAVKISGTNSFDQAQICSGGIDTCEIKDTLESKLIPGLYFAGEIIDIDGDCGGYNLQWAWSTGMLAAKLL